MENRRSATDRRLAPGTCARAICHHPLTEHDEGMGACHVVGCGCPAALLEAEGAPAEAPLPAQTVPAKKGRPAKKARAK